MSMTVPHGRAPLLPAAAGAFAFCLGLASGPLATGVTSASAAIRQCMQPIASEIVPAQNEALGKQMALKSWGDKAKKRHGTEFSSWRAAARKVLGCRPAADGSAPVQCVAYAAPCRIEQVPGGPPQPRNRLRTPPGAAIDT